LLSRAVLVLVERREAIGEARHLGLHFVERQLAVACSSASLKRSSNLAFMSARRVAWPG
jgi:hypothetical protein